MKEKSTNTSSFGTSSRVNHDSSKFYNSNLYYDIKNKEEEVKIENFIPEKFINKFILGSAENMQELPDNSIHLMVTSPPYNVTKEYDDNLTLREYVSLLKEKKANVRVIEKTDLKEVYKILKR